MDIIITFDKWYESIGNESFEFNGSYTLDDLRNAWNAAIESAELIVLDKYDEQDPWLEPGEIKQILNT